MAAVTERQLIDFVVREARLLDEKRYAEWNALFTDDAFYWVPLVPDQESGLDHTSHLYEDKLLRELRIERLKSPRAFSQRPASRCLHVMQVSDLEEADYERGQFLIRTPFIYTETRGDESQRYAATAWHTLVWTDERLQIRLKRVDLLNCDAALPSIQLFL
jgi:3-phenylpropionate/cinnamic acid dioxygenase small subunit